MKYIDADRLRAEIERRLSLLEGGTSHPEVVKRVEGVIKGYNSILSLIDSLQQEHLEMDVISTAKVFLEALSKTPYNNKPITDAQIIVKQLLIFLKTPSKYNPDAIVEQPEVDLEKEIDAYFDNYEIASKEDCYLTHVQACVFAKHFYELGRNARKEE